MLTRGPIIGGDYARQRVTDGVPSLLLIMSRASAPRRENEITSYRKHVDDNYYSTA